MASEQSLGERRAALQRARWKALEPPSSEITDRGLLLGRRRFTRLTTGYALLSSSLGSARSLASTSDSLFGAREEPTPKDLATGYNNYLEFSSNKEAVRILARELTMSPWSLRIDGEVEEPLELDPRDLGDEFETEERIYRFRCVEGWSMVVPWTGVPLHRVLERVKPTSRARFVRFTSLNRPSEMVGQRLRKDEWPFTEGLRLDEALHPLTLLVTGMYGEALPAQNGGPLRLIVPWKYGYKSAKALVHITLTQQEPATTWQSRSPSEYGFYGNVNPAVAHPRWSQARENRLGELRKRPTLPFNGYEPAVAQLYTGMDPRTLY